MTGTSRLVAAVLLAAPFPLHAAWLGVTVTQLSGAGGESGEVRVEQVVPSSPAERSGLRPGDVIVSVDGRSLAGCGQLSSTVHDADPGRSVLIRVRRSGQTLDLPVVLDSPPAGRSNPQWSVMPPPEAPVVLRRDERKRGYLGVLLLPLTQGLRDYFGAGGVLVSEVEPGSPADRAGLKAGDLIQSLGDKVVTDPADVQREVRGYRQGDRVPIEILRNGRPIKLEAEMEEKEAQEIYLALSPDGKWAGEFDPEQFRRQFQDYEEVLRHHLEGLQKNKDKDAWAQKLEALKQTQELFARDAALRNLFQNPSEDLKRLLESRREVLDDLSRRLAEQEKDLGERERRIEELESRVQELERQLREQK